MTRISENGTGAATAAPLPGTERIPGLDFLAAAILSAAVFTFAHWQGFVNPYAINDDVRQQVYWMQRWVTSGLYPDSLLNAYAEAYVPWGIKFIFWCGSWFKNPLAFSTHVAGVLFMAQALLLMAIGGLCAGRRSGWATLAAGLLMPFFLENISGGLSRAFASPLLAAFCYSLLLRGWFMGWVLAAQAIFIPYIFLPCAGTLVLNRAWSQLRGQVPIWLRTKREWVTLVVSTALVGVYTLAYGMKGFGPLVSLSETLGRPEFGPQGRLDLVPLPNPFLDFVYYPFERIGLFKEFGLFTGIASLVFLAPILWFGGRVVDWRGLARKLKPLALTGAVFLAFYVAARVVAFKLFVPDRYAQYPVNLLYAILLAACLAGAVKRLGVTKLMAAGLILLAAGLGAVRLKNVALYDYSADAPLFTAVEAATPNDAMLAGHPLLMDNVMTFSRRNAYATFELAHPWSKGYWEQLAPRLDGFFKAYYAADAAEVIRFAKESAADYLLVDVSHFTPAFLSGSPFFEPYGSRIKQMTAGRSGFAVLDGAVFTRIPLRPGAFLIDLRPLRGQDNHEESGQG